MPDDAKVVVDMYELVKLALPAIGRFPRSHRFTIGERLENRMLDALEFLERARFGLKRAESLAEADAHLRTGPLRGRPDADAVVVRPGVHEQGTVWRAFRAGSHHREADRGLEEAGGRQGRAS